MAKNLLNEIANRQAYKKQDKKLNKTTAPKGKKIRYNKTVQITEPMYNKLKEYSFFNNIPMAEIVTKSVRTYLLRHRN